jgi:hypothetical protein
MDKKVFVVMILLCFINISIIFSQDNKILNFNHRITIGNYNSYLNDDIGVLEAGYDFILNILYIMPEYNIFDFGIGLSGLFAFDNIDNPREPVFGLGINGSMRLYSPIIKITRFFLEGIMSLVIYTEEYPKNGTMINGGWHLGGGIEYNLGNNTKLFTKILWFHTSNNDVHGRKRNPSLSALGLAIGIQL